MPGNTISTVEKLSRGSKDTFRRERFCTQTLTLSLKFLFLPLSRESLFKNLFRDLPTLTFVSKVSEHVWIPMAQQGDAVPHHLQLLVRQHASLQPRWNITEIYRFIYLFILYSSVSQSRGSVHFGCTVNAPVLRGTSKKVANETS